jgi:hypothetical protein
MTLENLQTVQEAIQEKTMDDSITWEEIKAIAADRGVILKDDDRTWEFEFEAICERIGHMYEAMAENDKLIGESQ